MVPIVVTGRHRPHQVMLLVISAVAGLAFAVGAKPPSTLDRLAPGWVLWTWYVLLLASGVVGLTALAVSDPYRVLVLERAAMIGQMAAPALYGVALAASGQAAAMFAALFCAGWSAASVWRGWQVHRGLRALHRGDPGGMGADAAGRWGGRRYHGAAGQSGDGADAAAPGEG